MTEQNVSLSLLLSIALVIMTGCAEDNPLTANHDAEVSRIGFSEAAGQTMAVAKKSSPSLQNTIVYAFTAHLGIIDAEGRRLVWTGAIHGDIEGQIKWWFVPGGGPPNMPDAAHVSFYEGRWEIWDGVDLLLAGESAGSTARPPNKDGIWRGNGRVTEVGAGFEEWINRPISEGGNVNFTFPYSGEGMFRIN